MFKLKAFFALFFVIATLNAAKGNFIEDLDSKLWRRFDDTCQALTHQRDDIASPENALFLRIIQYTTFSYETHSVYPSAAKSLLRSKNFNASLPTVIFAHGFTDSPLLISGRTFAEAFKIHGNFNILAIDSSKLIRIFYMRSATLVRYAGEYLGYFIHELTRHGINKDNVYIVGHSLGAHIAGFAGKAFRVLNNGRTIGRITGMDPAGPCFFGVDADARLNASDATFVDVIHTNIGVYGLNKTIGHADFYPNGGGLRQPGCVESVCSHNRVWQLYEESVNLPKNFIGVQCDSKKSFDEKRCMGNKRATMGFRAKASTRGKYFLRTRGFFPFGMKELGIM